MPTPTEVNLILTTQEKKALIRLLRFEIKDRKEDPEGYAATDSRYGTGTLGELLMFESILKQVTSKRQQFLLILGKPSKKHRKVILREPLVQKYRDIAAHARKQARKKWNRTASR